MQKEGIEEGAADTRRPQLLMPPGQHVLSNFMGFTECTTDDHVFGQMTPDRSPALFRDIDLPVWVPDMKSNDRPTKSLPENILQLPDHIGL